MGLTLAQLSANVNLPPAAVLICLELRHSYSPKVISTFGHGLVPQSLLLLFLAHLIGEIVPLAELFLETRLVQEGDSSFLLAVVDDSYLRRRLVAKVCEQRGPHTPATTSPPHPPPHTLPGKANTAEPGFEPLSHGY